LGVRTTRFGSPGREMTTGGSWGLTSWAVAVAIGLSTANASKTSAGIEMEIVRATRPQTRPSLLTRDMICPKPAKIFDLLPRTQPAHARSSPQSRVRIRRCCIWNAGFLMRYNERLDAGRRANDPLAPQLAPNVPDAP